MKWLVAVDPGKTGAVAVFDVKKERFLRGHQFAVPSRQRFFHEQQIDDLFELLPMKMVGDTAGVIELFLDRRMHRQSPAHANTTAANWGFLWMQLALICPDVETVEPRLWKGRLGLTKDKDESLDMARTLFPEAADMLKLKKNHDMAEAILIGLDYGRRHFDWSK